MKISEIIQFLESRGIPFAVLGSLETGRAVAIEDGARILGLSAPGSEQNVFWCHPQISQCKDRAELSRVGVGGMGGLRLWQAPESAYMWKGQPDTTGFSNYQVQRDCDPGHYTLEQTSSARCIIQGHALLTDCRTGGTAGLEIRRIVEVAPLPESYQIAGAEGILLRQQNSLRLTEGDADIRADLWHLLQLPVPSHVGALIEEGADPVRYFNPAHADGWISEGKTFTWHTNGLRMCKLGFSASDLTGRLFATVDLGGRTGVYSWNIPVWENALYVDSPPDESRNDQAVQFWDGFGFCEVEYHSPGVSLERPEVLDTSELIYVEVATEHKARLFDAMSLPRN